MRTQALLNKAHACHQAGDYAAAKAAYEALLAIAPQDIAGLHGLAMLHVAHQEIKEALSLIQTAIEHAQPMAALYNTEGNLYLRLDQLAAARTAYQRAIACDPNYPLAYNNLGRLAQRDGQHKAAMDYYQQAIDKKPDYRDAHYNLGLCYQYVGAMQPAIACFEQVIRYQPDSASAHQQIAQCHAHGKAYDRALTHYQQAHAHAPDDPTCLLGLGQTHLALKQLEPAKQYLEAALALAPDLPDLPYPLGLVSLLDNAPDQALAYFFQALTLAPHADVDYHIGLIFMQKNRFQDAIDYYQQALKKNPDHRDARYNLASLYLTTQQREKAITAYQVLAERHPDDESLPYILSGLTQQAMPKQAPDAYITHLFDAYADHYDQHMTQALDYQAHTQLIDALDLADDPKTPAPVLELGCGTGLCGPLIAPYANPYIGIDLSPQMIAQAKKTEAYTHLAVMNLTDALTAYPDNHLLIAVDVLSYLGDLSEVMSLAYQALRPGGRFALTVEKATQAGYHLQHTLRYAHHATYLEALATAAGFKIDYLATHRLRQENGQAVWGHLVILTK